MTAVPFWSNGVDDTQPRGCMAAGVCSERDCKSADLPASRSQATSSELLPEPKNSNVCSRIAPRRFGFYGRPSCNHQLELVELRQRLLGSNDDVRSPQRASNVPSLTQPDCGNH